MKREIDPSLLSHLESNDEGLGAAARDESHAHNETQRTVLGSDLPPADRVRLSQDAQRRHHERVEAIHRTMRQRALMQGAGKLLLATGAAVAAVLGAYATARMAHDHRRPPAG